jgi:hypothetical protein
MRIRDSAMRGISNAKANMGIMYMFGFQTVLDSKLLGEAIQEGVKPEAANILII